MPPMSAANGGAIPSGTYFEEQAVFYQGSTAYSTTDTHQVTLILDTTQGTVTVLDSENGAPSTLFSGTFSMGGNTAMMQLTCPQMAALGGPYSYSNGTLTLFNFSKNELNVFAKQ